MDKTNLKEQAVNSLKTYDDAAIIIETISKCYQTVDVQPSKEESFLINELNWFVKEIKG